MSRKKLTICCMPDCGQDAIARHLCRKHYSLQHYHGTAKTNAGVNVKTGRDALCSVEDCLAIVSSQGFCNKHYKRFLAHGDISTVNTLRKQEGPCGAIGCGKIIERGQFCEKHYQQWWKTGFPYRRIAEAGTWSKNIINGYMVGTVDGVRMYEHRYLAEKALGKPLPPDAEIHHMNGVKHDNHRLYNLVICPDRAYHMLLEKRARDLGLWNALFGADAQQFAGTLTGQ